MASNSSYRSEEIAIATTTFYPAWYKGNLRSIKHTDKVRGDLALEFIQNAKAQGYQVVIVDGRSSRSFRSVLSKLKGIKVAIRRGPKRSPARRQAITTASKLPGVKIIVLVEPEKLSFLTQCMQLAVEPIFKDQADIVVPKRDEELFRLTYPSYMYESEVEANKLYNEILRSHGILDGEIEDMDVFFGPRVFKNNKTIVSLFMKKFQGSVDPLLLSYTYFDAEEFSNTIFFPIVLALKKRLRVKSVTIPFHYPKIQKENEEKGARELFLAKRKAQRLSILLDLIQFVGFLAKKGRNLV